MGALSGFTRHTSLAVAAYLAAIVAANLLAATFGPAVTVLNAAVLISLDLVLRDRLHEAWKGDGLWLRMGLLIVTGSVLSWALNQDAGRIGLASALAFGAAGVVDTVVYVALGKRAWLVRVNGSNVASAAVDSALFVWLAFGVWLPWVVLGQWLVKVAGGLVWSVLLVNHTAPVYGVRPEARDTARGGEG